MFYCYKDYYTKLQNAYIFIAMASGQLCNKQLQVKKKKHISLYIS